MHSTLQSLKSAALHLLYPALCLHCKGQTKACAPLFCSGCLEAFAPIDPAEFGQATCKKRGFLQGFAAVFEKSGPPATLLEEFKDPRGGFLADAVAGWLAWYLLELQWPLPDLIAPMELPFLEWVGRGFHRNKEVTRSLGTLLQRPLLSLSQRRELDECSFQGRTVLLIDCLAGDGAFNVAARRLAEEGVGTIYGLSFCLLDRPLTVC